MTSTNDGKDVKSNQISGQKGKKYFIELYKSLEAVLNEQSPLPERTEALCEAWSYVYSLCLHSAPSTHTHLLTWIQRHTARTLVQTEWQKSSAERERLENALDAFLAQSQAPPPGAPTHSAPPPGAPPTEGDWVERLRERAEWFKKILPDPWGHPVLRQLIQQEGGPQPTDDEVLQWLTEERGVMFATRLRQLAASKKCADLALALAAAVAGRARRAARDEDCPEPKEPLPNETSFVETLKKQAGFTPEVWELVADLELVLLHKQGATSSCIELAKQIPLRTSHTTIERLRSRCEAEPRDKKLWKNARDVATLVAQVVIARCMVRPVCAAKVRAALFLCTKSLVGLVPGAALPAAAAALAAPAASARHLHTLATAAEAQLGDDMKPLVVSLYVRAVSAGANELEPLRLNAEKEAEARAAEATLSLWLCQLGAALAASPRLRRECLLTAFSVHPARATYDLLRNTPPLPPAPAPDQEQRETPSDTPPSEFGSWATDSQQLTNFVKTSQSLNMQGGGGRGRAGGVLSSCVLTEGEALGLGADLCQDLAAVLSGPRVKTLSWDMDRAELLESCRLHMERPGGGTRPLTTELRFLNLDPAEYGHLPEEEEGEDDLYYGIEKGYEHLVELPEPEPEEIWASAFEQHYDREPSETESEPEAAPFRRRKKRRQRRPRPESDDDPLSLHAEKKEAKPKRERVRSKKTRKPNLNKNGTVRKPRRRVFPKMEQPLGPSLTSLIGMKVSSFNTADILDPQKIYKKREEKPEKIKKEKRTKKDKSADASPAVNTMVDAASQKEVVASQIAPPSPMASQKELIASRTAPPLPMASQKKLVGVLIATPPTIAPIASPITPNVTHIAPNGAPITPRVTPTAPIASQKALVGAVIAPSPSPIEPHSSQMTSQCPTASMTSRTSFSSPGSELSEQYDVMYPAEEMSPPKTEHVPIESDNSLQSVKQKLVKLLNYRKMNSPCSSPSYMTSPKKEAHAFEYSKSLPNVEANKTPMRYGQFINILATNDRMQTPDPFVRASNATPNSYMQKTTTVFNQTVTKANELKSYQATIPGQSNKTKPAVQTPTDYMKTQTAEQTAFKIKSMEKFLHDLQVSHNAGANDLIKIPTYKSPVDTTVVKKTDNVPNTFSRLSYMHKNRNVEVKPMSQKEAVSMEVERTIKELQKVRTAPGESQRPPQSKIVAANPQISNLLNSPQKSTPSDKTKSGFSETNHQELVNLRHAKNKMTGGTDSTYSNSQYTQKPANLSFIQKSNFMKAYLSEATSNITAVAGASQSNSSTIAQIPSIKTTKDRVGNEIQGQTDWESVMNTIQSLNTPSRGPKALEITMKKALSAPDMTKIKSTKVKKDTKKQLTETEPKKKRSYVKKATCARTAGYTGRNLHKKPIELQSVIARNPDLVVKHSNPSGPKPSADVLKTQIKLKKTVRNTNNGANALKTLPDCIDVKTTKMESKSSNNTVKILKIQNFPPSMMRSSVEIKAAPSVPKNLAPVMAPAVLNHKLDDEQDLLDDFIDKELLEEIGELSSDEESRQKPGKTNIVGLRVKNMTAKASVMHQQTKPPCLNTPKPQTLASTLELQPPHVIRTLENTNVLLSIPEKTPIMYNSNIVYNPPQVILPTPPMSNVLVIRPRIVPDYSEIPNQFISFNNAQNMFYNPPVCHNAGPVPIQPKTSTTNTIVVNQGRIHAGTQIVHKVNNPEPRSINEKLSVIDQRMRGPEVALQKETSSQVLTKINEIEKKSQGVANRLGRKQHASNANTTPQIIKHNTGSFLTDNKVNQMLNALQPEETIVQKKEGESRSSLDVIIDEIIKKKDDQEKKLATVNENTKEDTEENKEDKCRRILLRSSNQLKPTGIESPDVAKKTKARLKAVNGMDEEPKEKSTKKTNKKKTHVDSTQSPKRTSKRVAEIKAMIDSRIDETQTKPAVVSNITNEIDFEEELIGAKIHKVPYASESANSSDDEILELATDDLQSDTELVEQLSPSITVMNNIFDKDIETMSTEMSMIKNPDVEKIPEAPSTPEITSIRDLFCNGEISKPTEKEVSIKDKFSNDNLSEPSSPVIIALTDILADLPEAFEHKNTTDQKNEEPKESKTDSVNTGLEKQVIEHHSSNELSKTTEKVPQKKVEIENVKESLQEEKDTKVVSLSEQLKANLAEDDKNTENTDSTTNKDTNSENEKCKQVEFGSSQELERKISEPILEICQPISATEHSENTPTLTEKIPHEVNPTASISLQIPTVENKAVETAENVTKSIAAAEVTSEETEKATLKDIADNVAGKEVEIINLSDEEADLESEPANKVSHQDITTKVPIKDKAATEIASQSKSTLLTPLPLTVTNEITNETAAAKNALEEFIKNISIENVFIMPAQNGEPLKKIVKIKRISTNSPFKITISGNVNINMKTMFNNPQIRSIIMEHKTKNNDVFKQKYRLNESLDMLTNPDENQTGNLEMAGQKRPDPIVKETIDLISDDEEEIKSVVCFTNDQGSFKVPFIDAKSFDIHRLKLTSKCVIPLTRCPEPKKQIDKNNLKVIVKETNHGIKDVDVLVSAFVNDIIAPVLPKSLKPIDKQELTTEKPAPVLLPELIELDDSSNEALEALLPELPEILAAAVNATKPIRSLPSANPEPKIVELTHRLLSDLGVGVAASSNPIVIDDLTTDSDDGEDKVVTNKCYVRLERCDALACKYRNARDKRSIKLQNDGSSKDLVIKKSSATDILADFDVPSVLDTSDVVLDFGELDTTLRSESPSILNIVSLDQSLKLSDVGRTSPVMAAYDVLASLINKRKEKTSENLSSVKCETNSVSVAPNDCKLQFNAPTLVKTILNILENNDWISKLKPISKPVVQTKRRSLKRKTISTPANVPFGKVLKTNDSDIQTPITTNRTTLEISKHKTEELVIYKERHHKTANEQEQLKTTLPKTDKVFSETESKESEKLSLNLLNKVKDNVEDKPSTSKIIAKVNNEIYENNTNHKASELNNKCTGIKTDTKLTQCEINVPELIVKDDLSTENSCKLNNCTSPTYNNNTDQLDFSRSTNAVPTEASKEQELLDCHETNTNELKTKVTEDESGDNEKLDLQKINDFESEETLIETENKIDINSTLELNHSSDSATPEIAINKKGNEVPLKETKTICELQDKKSKVNVINQVAADHKEIVICAANGITAIETKNLINTDIEPKVLINEVITSEKETKLINTDKDEVTIKENTSDIIKTAVSNTSTPSLDEEPVIFIKGIEYEDPVVGTCYIFQPIADSSSETDSYRTCVDSPAMGSDCINDSTEYTDDPQVTDDESLEKPDFNNGPCNHNNDPIQSVSVLADFEYTLVPPNRIYRRKHQKRKMSMLDVKIPEKKYRKGKNIDNPKLSVTTMIKSAYAKEFNKVLTYMSTIKLSYDRWFLSTLVDGDLDNAVTNWQIAEPRNNDIHQQNVPTEECPLFTELKTEEDAYKDPLERTLNEELSPDLFETFPSTEEDETDFSMGFGEGSGRVIQNFIGGGDSKISAATLSDVKHAQPSLLSEHRHKSEVVKHVRRYLNYVKLREKVRSFFEKSKIELATGAEDKKERDAWSVLREVPGLNSAEFLTPPPLVRMVNVVQVGQLPVSAAAQNPVTCDPRVTQVSDASPSRCSVENSPGSDNNQNLKAEYTELTTADLSFQSFRSEVSESLPESYSDDQCTPHEDLNGSNNTDAITTEKDNSAQRHQDSNIDFHFDANSSYDTSNTSFEASHRDTVETTSQKNNQEKSDQNAHMNAGGSADQDTNRPHPLIGLLAKSNQNSHVNDQNGTENYVQQKQNTSISAMALQQALAQILPPPLNQTTSENNQEGHTSQHPPVLHFVQGKNAAGNPITLVDSSQQSVLGQNVLHIVQQNSSNQGQSSNGMPGNYSGLSLVDAGLQQGGNQLLHIVNTGNQKAANAAGQILKRVNLLTNLANVQGNEQKMLQFVCKSADGKSIHLNAPHQRSMVLRLQPIETPVQQPPKSVDQTDGNQDEMKTRSIYEDNFAKYIQTGTPTSTPSTEKATSLPKFNQAFGKPVFEEGNHKDEELNSDLPMNEDGTLCTPSENPINMDHMNHHQISSPPLLIRKQTTNAQTPQSIIQQIKNTIAPMNIQTMHGGVIYTRQIPVNIGGGQTINLITVPTTELVDESGQKQQSDIEPSIIKIVPQAGTENQEDSGNETPQPQPVLTQMRIKLPMLSKSPQVGPGTRLVRPSFFQIQRNVVGGGNQPVYQQLVLTAAPPLGQQTIRLPQAAVRTVKPPSETPSPSESELSSSTLEQLREFDMVLEQVKERSIQPSTPNSAPSTSESTVICSQNENLFTVGAHQTVTFVRKTSVTTPTTSTFVRSPDSTGIVEAPSASIPRSVDSVSGESPPKPKISSKSIKSKSKALSSTPSALKVNHNIPPKPSTQKPIEDEQTTQRILYILAEYKEQVENSPDKDKPAPRRRSNPPTNPGSSKRKKSRRPGCTRDHSPIMGDDSCRTMGSEDSSCGTSQGDCSESCIDAQSPQDSPRKVVRKLTFEPETPVVSQPPLVTPTIPPRNVIVADGQTITVARTTTGKPTTAVLMPANYILPVSMVKGGQQIAIVTNRGPKLLTVGGTTAEGATTNALLLQRLIGPAGLKPMLARPGIRHVRLPTAALHNLQAFNLAATPSLAPQTPDSTASPAAAAAPDLADNKATSSPWAEDAEAKQDASSKNSEPWSLQTSSDTHEYTYEEPVTPRSENIDRTVLDSIPDRYTPDMEAQRIFDKMFEVDTKKTFINDSPRATSYDLETQDCEDRPYQQVVHRKERSAPGLHRVFSAAQLRHKYAILEQELRLQKSLSEECEDLGVDSPSASELFPEAELLFTGSPAHDQHHDHTHAPAQQHQLLTQHTQPDLEDHIATDTFPPTIHRPAPAPLNLTTNISVNMASNMAANMAANMAVNIDGLSDVGIVSVGEDGNATIEIDQEEFARSHPNTTFHQEPPTEDAAIRVQPFSLSSNLKPHIASTIFHTPTVLMTTQQTVISQGAPETNSVKYSDIDNIINNLPSGNNQPLMTSVLVKEGLTRYDNILTDSRELHLSNTASAIVHSNATQVIRRVCYEDKRDGFFDEPDNVIAGDDAKMNAAEDSREATLHCLPEEDDRSSPERHAELFWESNSASERSESRRPLDFSSDSEKCCKSPSLDDSTDSSGVGTHMRLDSVIKEARGRERSGSADGSSADDSHPLIRTYPAKRTFESEERSLSGKTRAGERAAHGEPRRRASGRGVVKRGCHCCNGSPAPSRPKKPRQRKPTLESNH